ncbi:MAG: hypothetical protein ACXVB3_01495 [Flavisolibacter sp.]
MAYANYFSIIYQQKSMKKPTTAVSEGEIALRLLPETKPSYEDITLINPKKELLTPSLLRSFDGFGSITDEEAENICRTSHLFAQVLLEFIAQKNTITIDNQHVVN